MAGARAALAVWVMLTGLGVTSGCDAPAPAPGTEPADAPVAPPAPAVETTPATPAETPAAELDERAIAIVRRAAQFLRDQPRIAVTVHTEYDTIQPETGEKLEFGSLRRILIQRPDRIRVETQPRDAGPRVTTFDGRLLTVLDVTQNAWAQVERKGDIDSTLDFMQADLGIPMPLSELWRADPSRDLVAELRDAYVVDTANLDGVICDHVFLRNDRADGQFWIERGDTPRFHRIAITYRDDDGQPAVRARYSDWSFAPEAGDDAFQFAPPPGADRILFAARPRATGTEEGQ